jgi:hypothetical protein
MMYGNTKGQLPIEKGSKPDTILTQVAYVGWHKAKRVRLKKVLQVKQVLCPFYGFFCILFSGDAY